MIKTSRELGIRPHIGVRARLTTKGAGKWVESTGDRSKFGLSARGDRRGGRAAARRGHARLPRAAALPHRLADHRDPRPQGRAARGEPHLRRPARSSARSPRILDVGGGLGVDYDGSQTNFHSSMNYSVQEYANDVVSAIQEACDEPGVPHPDIVTEAGRAMVAHHSVLVFDVLGVNEMRIGHDEPEPVGRGRPEGAPRPRRGVGRRSRARTCSRATTTRSSSRRRPRRSSRSATSTCATRARVERLFWACCEKILRIARELPDVPEELERPREAAWPTPTTPTSRCSSRARPLGGEAALPGHADPPARREADAARHLRRPHLRQRRQDRPVHRPARREGRARAAPLERRARTTSASSWSAPTRRSWATCTTCSATPTPCTCASTTTAATGRARRRGRRRGGRARLRRVRPHELIEKVRATSRRRCAAARSRSRSRRACAGATSRASGVHLPRPAELSE